MNNTIAKFKTRARAIEMLGKDQIANAPTAISELFKNAYDAFAREVSVDLYPEKDILILQDNGMGMSETDVNERWLVVGTGDKIKSDSNQFLKPGEVEPELLERAVMGEKGIGRLAIAAIGKQLFIFSHRINEKSVCLFVDWRIFKHLDLNLDEVTLPLRTLKEGELFTKSILSGMLKEFGKNFDNSKWESEKELKEEILNDLENLNEKIKIEDIINTHAFKDKRGTTFYISSLEDEFKNIGDIGPKNPKRLFENRLFRLLMGFRNVLEEKPIDMNCAFFIHKKERLPFNILSEREWWNKEELKIYDHLIEGEFDENGKFVGKIEIFGKPLEYVNLWKKQRKTKCGPFRICLRYLEGEIKASRLNKEEYNVMNNKLNMIGGFYVYRDGVRVLPYGEPDVDFLEFEERRSKHAGRHFFSHRRFFGYIATEKKNNKNLRDKASREGFIENAAYRDFRDILIHFFVDLAADHFSRKEAKKSDLHHKLTEQHKKEKKSLEEEEKRSAKKKKEFLKALNEQQKGWKRGIPLLEDLKNSSIKMLNEIEEETNKGHFTELEEKIAGVAELPDNV